VTLNDYTRTPAYEAAAKWSQKAAEAQDNGGSLLTAEGQHVGADSLAWFAADAYASLAPRP